MICNVISTGSKGNAVLLNNEILLDCGVPYKLLAPYVEGLRLVLLSHRHSDHFHATTIHRLHKERPTLRFGCCPWMVPELREAGVPLRVIDVYNIERRTDFNNYDNGRVVVMPFPLVHDVPNCGYKIIIGRETALYATDTATMDDVCAPGLDLYMIEANHTEQEIADRIRRKTEAGEFVYEHRVEVTHLSREAADAWLAMNAGRDSQVIYLHQHQE